MERRGRLLLRPRAWQQLQPSAEDPVDGGHGAAVLQPRAVRVRDAASPWLLQEDQVVPGAQEKPGLQGVYSLGGGGGWGKAGRD